MSPGSCNDSERDKWTASDPATLARWCMESDADEHSICYQSIRSLSSHSSLYPTRTNYSRSRADLSANLRIRAFFFFFFFFFEFQISNFKKIHFYIQKYKLKMRFQIYIQSVKSLFRMQLYIFQFCIELYINSFGGKIFLEELIYISNQEKFTFKIKKTRYTSTWFQLFKIEINDDDDEKKFFFLNQKNCMIFK